MRSEKPLTGIADGANLPARIPVANGSICPVCLEWEEGLSEVDIDPCNDPNSASDDVWAFTYANSTIWDDYVLLGVAYDGESVFDDCEDVFVDVHRWNEDWSTTWLATEWYKHTYRDPEADADYYDIWVGGPSSGDWRFSVSDEKLGVTVYPDDCDTTAYHVHQMYWEDGDTSLVTESRNNSLNDEEDLDQFDYANNFIHSWTGTWY